MKGIRGLILAIVAGLVGAMCNWFYLANRSREVESVAFIGIKSDVTINSGDKLTAEQLEPVPIPRQWVGNLDRYAYLYSDLRSVEGMAISRTQTGPALLLQQDLKTPPLRLRLNPSTSPDSQETVMWVPIDNRSFVPALVTPGEDLVSFLFSTGQPGPTLAPAEGGSGGEKPAGAEQRGPGELAPVAAAPLPRPIGAPEIIGPFKVLALGNRLGSLEVMRAAKQAPMQENVMAILVRLEQGKLEPRAARLWSLLEATNFRQVGVIKHAPQTVEN